MVVGFITSEDYETEVDDEEHAQPLAEQGDTQQVQKA